MARESSTLLVLVAIGILGCNSEEVYFSVKRDGAYEWNGNAVVRPIDFSSDSTVIQNAGGAFDAATATFTAPVAGTYTFHGVIYFDDIAPGDLVYAYLNVGSMNYEGPWIYATGNLQMVHVSATTHLDAGQSASLHGYVNASNPPGEVYGNPTNYAFTYFMGARVF